jgi:hypothetical protein
MNIDKNNSAEGARINELRSRIAGITDQLDGVLLDMMKASRSGLITGVTVGTIMDRLLNIIGDYRRA